MVSIKQELRKRQAKRGGMCGCEESLTRSKLDVAQLTERRIWDAEAVGLSPTIQTKPPIGSLVQIRHNMMDFAFAAVPPLAGIGRRKSAIG